MRAVLQNPVPCYTGSIYTEGKRISNNRLVVQGTTKHIACMEDLGLFSTLNSSAVEKISPPPPVLCEPTPCSFPFYNICYRGLMCWRWLDIFLIKIEVLNSYQVTKLAK